MTKDDKTQPQDKLPEFGIAEMEELQDDALDDVSGGSDCGGCTLCGGVSPDCSGGGGPSQNV